MRRERRAPPPPPQRNRPGKQRVMQATEVRYSPDREAATPSTDAGVAGAPRLLDQHERARRLTSIDALRGIAALAVVLTHIPREHRGRIDGTFFAFLPIDFGTLGVPLFLVISGFCIHLAVARRALEGHSASVDWAAFWKRRFYRLYPP